MRNGLERTPRSVFRVPRCNAFSGAHRICFRRHYPGRGGLLSIEAQAGGEAGVEHSFVAAVFGGHAGEFALPTAAAQLAADFSDSSAAARGVRIGATVLQRSNQTEPASGTDFG